MPYLWCPDYAPTNPNTMSEDQIRQALMDNLTAGRPYHQGLQHLHKPTDSCIFQKLGQPGTYTAHQGPARDWQESVAQYRLRNADLRCITHNRRPEIFFRFGPLSTRQRQVENLLFERKSVSNPNATWQYVFFLIDKRAKPKLIHDVWASP